MKKLLTLIFIFSLLLGACTPAATPTTAPVVEEIAPTEAPPPAPTEEPAPIFTPVELVDALGNELTIEEPPTRIISLAPSITETLYAIGVGDLLVGRTDFDNYPEAVLDLPSVGGFSADMISIETILDLEPDIVIGGSVWQADVIDALNESGIPSVTFERNSVATIMDLMILLGKATGHEADAIAAVNDMETRLNAVASVIETIPEEERVTVYYEVWHEPLMTTTDQTFIGELIGIAGGENIFADLEETYPAVSAEEIIDANPDVILGPSSHGDQLTAEMISTREGWSGLAAVENNAIYIVDGDTVSRAGPRIVDALEEIAQAFYPAYFE